MIPESETGESLRVISVFLIWNLHSRDVPVRVRVAPGIRGNRESSSPCGLPDLANLYPVVIEEFLDFANRVGTVVDHGCDEGCVGLAAL